MSVSRETFAYYLSEAENGWCKIPRRVADDMALYCANLEAKLAEARKVIERYERGLNTIATTFYKDDQHQDYAKHVLDIRNLEPRL